MTQRRNSLADRLSDRLRRAGGVIPSIEDHLNEQRALVTVIASSRTDSSGGGSKGDHSDPAVRTILELDRIESRRTAIRDALATLTIATNLLDDACRDALGHQARREPDDEAKPRCIGDNTAAGATCWQIPAPRRDHGTNQTIDDGRCLDCGGRMDAEKREESNERRKRRHAKGAA